MVYNFSVAGIIFNKQMGSELWFELFYKFVNKSPNYKYHKWYYNRDIIYKFFSKGHSPQNAYRILTEYILTGNDDYDIPEDPRMCLENISILMGQADFQYILKKYNNP